MRDVSKKNFLSIFCALLVCLLLTGSSDGRQKFYALTVAGKSCLFDG
jgi:hypothetical protein